MYLYRRIRDLREDNDLSQQKVAEYLDITRQQYQLYECGSVKCPCTCSSDLQIFTR